MEVLHCKGNNMERLVTLEFLFSFVSIQINVLVVNVVLLKYGGWLHGSVLHYFADPTPLWVGWGGSGALLSLRCSCGNVDSFISGAITCAGSVLIWMQLGVCIQWEYPLGQRDWSLQFLVRGIVVTFCFIHGVPIFRPAHSLYCTCNLSQYSEYL